MLIEKYLQENAFNGIASEIEPSEEGLLFEQGGFSRAIDMALQESHVLNTAMLGVECKCCGLLTENAVEEAMALQENAVTSIFGKLIALVKSLWKRMTEVMNSVALYFSKFVNEKGFLQKAEEALKNLNDFSGLEFEGYTYTLDKVDPGTIYKTLIKSVENKYNAAKNKVGVGSANQLQDQINAANKLIEEAGNAEAYDGYAQAGFKCKKAEITDTLFKALRNGAEKKEVVKFDKSTCTAAINGFKSAKADVDAIRKQINFTHADTIKAITDAQKSIKDASAQGPENVKSQYTVELKRLSELSKTIKDMLIWSNKACDAKISALKEQKSQDKNLIMKAISKAHKNNKVDMSKTTESVDVLDQFMQMV